MLSSREFCCYQKVRVEKNQITGRVCSPTETLCRIVLFLVPNRSFLNRRRTAKCSLGRSAIVWCRNNTPSHTCLSRVWKRIFCGDEFYPAWGVIPGRWG